MLRRRVLNTMIDMITIVDVTSRKCLVNRVLVRRCVTVVVLHVWITLAVSSTHVSS